MGLGQGSRAAPSLWIQLSTVLVNVNKYKQLGLGGYIIDPISMESTHMMGAIFVDNADLYTGVGVSDKPTELWRQTQTNVD